MLNPREAELLLNACRSLTPSSGRYDDSDAILIVIILPLDTRLRVPTLAKAGSHFRAIHRKGIRTLSDIQRLLRRFPTDRAGNERAAMEIWGYRYWNRLPHLRSLVDYLVSVGVETEEDLREWAKGSRFQRDFEGRVRGIGFALYKLLVMQLGVDTVKPDKHVHDWSSGIFGRRLSDEEIVEVLENAARELGIPARELDLRIWEHQKGKG